MSINKCLSQVSDERISVKSQLRLPQTLIQKMKKKSFSQTCSAHLQKNDVQDTCQKPKRNSLTSKISQKELSFMRIPFKTKKRDDKVDCIQICKICQGQYKASSFITISDKCNHYYCRDCLHTYAIIQISSFSKVICPSQQCQQKIHQQCNLFKQLPLKIKNQYIKYQKLRSLKSNQRLCPFQYCQGIIIIPQGGTSQKIKINCSKCQKDICSLCFMKYHQRECEKDVVLYYEASLHYRQCKACNTIIERITGCDHMICRCGYEFCYLCGQKWRPDHQCHTTPDCCFKVTLCWLLCKIIYIIAYILIIYPLIIFRSIATILVILCSAIFIGLFAGICILLQKFYKINTVYFTLGIIFFPLLIIAGVFYVAIDMIYQVGYSIFSHDILCGPCLTIVRFCDEIKQRFYNDQ